jgi:hypothetical protein
MKNKLPIIVAAVIFVAVAGYGIYAFFFESYHFAVVQDGVFYRSGLQGLRRFHNTYRWHPFKCVINLQSESDLETKYEEQAAEERMFCLEHGITYLRLPIKEKTPPTPEQAAQFLKWAGDPKNQPVLAHDSQGVIREGMMVALWQMEKMHYSKDEALKAIRWFGHDPSPVLLEFIKQYRSAP